MKDLIHYIDRGVLSLDSNLNVISWNNWLQSRTTIDSNEIIGRRLIDFFPEIEKRISYKQLERAVQQKKSLVLSPLLHKYLIPIKNPSIFRKEGVELMLQLTHGVSVTDENGENCYLIQIEDQTERFLKEKKIKKYYDDLDVKNSELARIQKELEEKNKILEDTNKYKSEFLANMSHEIRTPMNSILGVTDLLIDDSENLTDSQKEMLNVINISSSSLMELINDILDLAKIAAQKLIIEKVEFELEAVLMDIFKVIASRTFDKNLTLVCNCPLMSNWINADITRIKQILTNLLGNSAKFTGEGEIRIDVSISENYDSLTLKIIDTGIGISEENLSKIFDSFVQADGSTTRKFGGTGLGLSLCKELTELMDGEISVKSKLGAGTEFTVKVPIDKGAEIEPINVNEKIFEQKIIYIDKDQTRQKHMSRMLESLKIDCTICGLNQGREKLQNLQWDIVLVDQLTINNDLLKNLKSQSKAKIINVHKLLNNSFSHDAVFHHHLSRPFSHKHLHRILEAKINSKVITSVNEFSVISSDQKRILIAEDNKSNQFLLKKILKDFYEFDFAQNGQEAVDMLKTNSYDLILMDILMPIKDGHEATSEIRTFNQEIPILALTANNLENDRERCLASGMNDYIIKPVNRHLLIDKIEEYTGISKSEPA